MPFTAAADPVALLPAMVTPEPLEETGPPSPRSPPIGRPVPTAQHGSSMSPSGHCMNCQDKAPVSGSAFHSLRAVPASA